MPGMQAKQRQAPDLGGFGLHPQGWRLVRRRIFVIGRKKGWVWQLFRLVDQELGVVVEIVREKDRQQKDRQQVELERDQGRGLGLTRVIDPPRPHYEARAAQADVPARWEGRTVR
jgi:hypothetical protein